jgi:hypothetical protein
MSGRAYASSIHRFIKNKLSWLGRVLGYREVKPVSRAQLPRILDGVDWSALNETVKEQFGVRIEVQDQEWYAVDGKTLRGVAGQRERVLLAVSHTERGRFVESCVNCSSPTRESDFYTKFVILP